MAIGGIAYALARIYQDFQVPYDYKLFWMCGRDVLAGADYYAIDPRDGGPRALNPPTALPLFAAFGALPLRKGARLWTALNALLGLALVPLAHRGLVAQGGPDTPRLPKPVLGVLSAAVAFSNAYQSNLALGQLGIVTAAALLAALWAQAAGRPILAGLALAVATIKPPTTLPVLLLLFSRRQDRVSWLSLAVATLVLCLASGPPGELPGRLAHNARNILVSASPGMVNDYSYAGPSHNSMLGLDHMLYRLGLRDRRLIAVLQAAGLAAIGIGLFRAVHASSVSRPSACALAALYAVLFLYHRVYDTILLVLPLVHATILARTSPHGPRRRVLVAAIAVLLVLMLYPSWLLAVERLTFRIGGWGWLPRAILLPVATWLVLLGLFALWSGAARLRRRTGSA